MTPAQQFARDYFTLQRISSDRQQLVLRCIAELEAHADRPIHECEAGHFRGYLAGMLDRGLHVNTVRKHANALRPFFKWAWREGIIDADRYMRLRDVENPRGSSGEGKPRPYKSDVLRQLWTDLDARWPLDDRRWVSRWQRGLSRYPKVWPHAMHLQLEAIIRLALDCGLRRMEIREAAIVDIHPDNAYVVVPKGKAVRGHEEGKYREVPMTVAARTAIATWLDFRGLVMAHFDVEHDRPWLGLHPTASPNSPIPSTPAAPANSKRFGELLPSLGAWELHRLRHTCGTEWLRAGMPLEQVRDLLGHANIRQTLAYAEIVRDDLQRTSRRVEPDFERAVGRGT